jgi:enterochelin esterase-like enzyme
MAERRGVMLAAVASMAVAWTASMAGGTTTVHRIESEAVAGNMMGITNVRPVLVYTPEGYEDTARRYPVIYWLPGWETPASMEYVGALDAAISKRWIPPVIVVIVDVREGVLMLNSPVFGAWADYLIDEMTPFIDAEYRTIPSPAGRALMGHSTGGYAAMLLPLLYPGVWSAVGLNDASVWGACATWGGVNLDDFDDYASLSSHGRAWVQVAIATAPNMDSPRLYDMPSASDDVRRAWRSRCLQDVGILREHIGALAEIQMIGLTLPASGNQSNRGANEDMVESLRHVGADPQVLYVEGTHGSHRGERFVFLAGLVASVMLPPSFDTSRSRAMAWGTLKTRRQPLDEAAAPAR